MQVYLLDHEFGDQQLFDRMVNVARKRKMGAICVPPRYVARARSALGDSPVRVIAIVGTS